MAKIDLVKQKKEEQANKPVTTFYASPEELYASAVKKMNLDQLIVQHKYKIENYLLAAAMFDAASEVPGAAEKAEECRELAEKTRQDQERYRYECAVRKEQFYNEDREERKLQEDWGQLKEEFQSLGQLEDAPAHADYCARRERQETVRSKRNRILALLAAVVIAGGTAACIHTGFHRYMTGRLYMAMERYSDAAYNFRKCPELLDSQERIDQCEKLAGKETDTEL